MKEKYVKPEIFIERFSLTQNIAAACGAVENGSLGTPTTGDRTSCKWDLGNNMSIFTSAANCTIPLGDNDTFEGVCFNAPNSNITVFGA